jgi:chemotaxis protein histidine kinase CheA
MPREKPIELFMPPNMLRAKAGGGFGGIDMGAIKRAQTAMETLKSEFAGMAGDDVQNLSAARDRYAADPGPESRAAMARAAHDLKGTAATYDFPLIARAATSLCKLMNEAPQSQALPAKLVDAHVFAIQVMHRKGLTGAEDKLALTLIGELDAQVSETLAKAK